MEYDLLTYYSQVDNYKRYVTSDPSKAGDREIIKGSRDGLYVEVGDEPVKPKSLKPVDEVYKDVIKLLSKHDKGFKQRDKQYDKISIKLNEMYATQNSTINELEFKLRVAQQGAYISPSEERQKEVESLKQELEDYKTNVARQITLTQQERYLLRREDELQISTLKERIYQVLDHGMGGTISSDTSQFKSMPNLPAVEHSITLMSRFIVPEVQEKISPVFVPIDEGSRASANYTKQTCSISPLNGEKVIAHEMAHLLEKDPTIFKATMDFYAKRTEGCNDEIIHGNESTKADKFIDKYTGRLYLQTENNEVVVNSSNGYNIDPSTSQFSTEILSMGAQHLLENPAEFAEKDPDHFKFVMKVFRGELNTTLTSSLSKVYVTKDPNKAPDDVDIQTGKHGGLFYNSEERVRAPVNPHPTLSFQSESKIKLTPSERKRMRDDYITPDSFTQLTDKIQDAAKQRELEIQPELQILKDKLEELRASPANTAEDQAILKANITTLKDSPLLTGLTRYSPNVMAATDKETGEIQGAMGYELDEFGDLYINLLGVIKPGQGVGSALIDQAKELTPPDRDIKLEALNNDNTFKFYESQGFKRENPDSGSRWYYWRNSGKNPHTASLSKVYVTKDPSKAPDGVETITGKRGGIYYNTEDKQTKPIYFKYKIQTESKQDGTTPPSFTNLANKVSAAAEHREEEVKPMLEKMRFDSWKFPVDSPERETISEEINTFENGTDLAKHTKNSQNMAVATDSETGNIKGAIGYTFWDKSSIYLATLGAFYPGEGVGSSLINHLKDITPEGGTIQLHAIDNQNTLKFYTVQGFKPVVAGSRSLIWNKPTSNRNL